LRSSNAPSASVTNTSIETMSATREMGLVSRAAK
jgi:hypothetical protein